jgi:glycerol-3-phosphate dehydrogenase (NAD(P)+)
MDVAIVGTGDRFVSILDLLVGSKDRTVGAVSLDGEELPAGVESTTIEDLVDARLIFIAVPITDLRNVARSIGDVITARHAVIHAVHNVEPGSLAAPSEVLLQEMPTRRFGFLTGPMRSDEIERGLPSSGVCATRFPEVGDLAEEALVSPTFRLYRSSDLRGAEYSAAYTRVIAMAAGVAHAMSLGRCVQATLFARGLAEVSRFVTSRGAEEKTVFGIAGSANLHLDTTPPGSPDFQVGIAAQEAGEFDPVDVRERFGSGGGDLLDLVETLWAGVRSSQLHAHILETCHRMVSGQLEPQGALGHLMTLPTLNDV